MFFLYLLFSLSSSALQGHHEKRKFIIKICPIQFSGYRYTQDIIRKILFSSICSSASSLITFSDQEKGCLRQIFRYGTALQIKIDNTESLVFLLSKPWKCDCDFDKNVIYLSVNMSTKCFRFPVLTLSFYQNSRLYDNQKCQNEWF